MTGEMSWADLKHYPDLLSLASSIQKQAKVAAEVRPFDVYQGPFVAVNFDMPPLKGIGIKKNQLGSWHAKIWYGSREGLFSLEYRNVPRGDMNRGTVVKMVKVIKKGWRK